MKGQFVVRRKSDFDYFDAFNLQLSYAEEMTLNLKSALEAGEWGGSALVQSLHTMENDADHVNHQIQSHLVMDFVTPFDRDSMSNLAHAFDDVCDAVEEIAIKAYLFNVSADSHPIPRGSSLMLLMSDACSELKIAGGCLAAHSMHRDAIRKHLVAVQTCESDCDALYISAVHGLYEDTSIDPEQRRITHALMDCMEEAMDALEHAAECMEALVAECA